MGLPSTARRLLRRIGLLRISDNWADLDNGVRALIYWFPVIWHDRPWDYVFLLRIMRHKIAQMSASTKDWLHIDVEDIKAEMDQVVGILDDLIETTHEEKAAEQHEAIFGAPRMQQVPFIAGLGELLQGKKDLVKIEIVYPETDDQELAHRGLIAMYRMAEYARQISLEALGRAMTRIERWWD